MTPDAMANAIASGRATMPTITPAIKSLKNCFELYVFNVLISSGFMVCYCTNVRKDSKDHKKGVIKKSLAKIRVLNDNIYTYKKEKELKEV